MQKHSNNSPIRENSICIQSSIFQDRNGVLNIEFKTIDVQTKAVVWQKSYKGYSIEVANLIEVISWLQLDDTYKIIYCPSRKVVEFLNRKNFDYNYFRQSALGDSLARLEGILKWFQ